MGVTKAAGAVKPWRSTLGLVLFLAVAVVVVVWMVNANDEQGKLAHERAIRAMQEVGSEPIAQQRD